MCLFTQTHHPPKRWLDHIEIQSFQTQWMMFSCLTNKNTCSHHPPGWSSFSSPWNLASEPWPCGEATGYVYIVYVDLQCSVYISLTANYLHILNLHTVFLHMLPYAYIMNWSARVQPSTLYKRSFGIGEPSKLWGLLWKFRLPQQVCFVVVCNIALQDCKHEIWQVLNLPKHIEELSGDLFCRKTHVHTSD